MTKIKIPSDLVALVPACDSDVLWLYVICEGPSDIKMMVCKPHKSHRTTPELRGDLLPGHTSHCRASIIV